ncbi:MAG: hypothetical protein H7Y06_00645 [Opitutaceae bacterium]|nr:hypothetical protein [Opitutaceae bacterium]
MSSLNKADSEQGPHMVAQFISQFTEISSNISRALHDECTKPGTKESIETNSFHARHWNRLREAVQLRVNPGQLDEIARETDVFIENGRIAELARAQDETKPAAAPPRTTTAPFQNKPANPSPGASPPPPSAKPALQLRSRRNVTGAPFGDIPPASPGAEGPGGSIN